MLLETKAVKTGIAASLPIIIETSKVSIDPLTILFIALGLLIGWMARVGKLISEDSESSKIRKDMLVSILIGSGNGLLALLIITTLGLNYIQGVAVAFICAFAGIKTFETGFDLLFQKLGYRKGNKND